MSARKEDEQISAWCRLVPHLVPEPVVAIVEALLWMQQPLSAIQIARLFDEPKHYYNGRVSYYLERLRKVDVLEVTGKRENRGAAEFFHYFKAQK